MKQSIAKKILKENKKIYEILAEDFSRTRDQNWPEIEKLTKYVRKGDKILDLGCGNGRLYKILKNKKVEYTGIDISEKLIEIAKKEFNFTEGFPKPKFIVEDVLNLSPRLKDQEFDTIFAVAFLHHIPSKDLHLKVLKKCFEVLKENSLIILSVWNLRQPQLIWKYKIWPFSKDVYIPWKLKTGEILKRYYHVFTKKELKQIVKKAGFKIIDSYFAGDNLIVIAKKL